MNNTELIAFRDGFEQLRNIQASFLKSINLDPVRSALLAQRQIADQISMAASMSLKPLYEDFMEVTRAVQMIQSSLKDDIDRIAQIGRQWETLIQPLILGFAEIGRFSINLDPLPPDEPDPPLVVSDLRDINEELLVALHKNPNLLHELKPRLFEKLVAEIMHRKGYEVELTPESKDGGIDLFAGKRDGMARMLFIVQCKRYGPANKVGVAPVRELHGVLTSNKANAGMIVTTSSFTKGATNYVTTNRLEYQLQLNDFMVLRTWVKSLGLGIR